ILHAVLGEPFDPERDPYEVPGFPRSVVKAWITASLGKGEHLQQWTPEQKADYAKDNPGAPPLKSYRIGEVRDAVVDHLPLLRRLGEPGTSGFDLMFIESEAVLDTILSLGRRGIPALPVHDSIIVP